MLDRRISFRMEILVIHSSVTQRKVFMNCLQKTGLGDVQAFASEREALKALNGTPAEVTILEKESLQTEGSPTHIRRRQALLDRSERIVVTSYQFTRDEAIALLDRADELLLMPFKPEVLEEKIRRLQN